MGRGGKLNINIDGVKLVNGTRIAVRGTKQAQGGGHGGLMTAGIVGTALVFWPAAPAFLLMKGKKPSRVFVNVCETSRIVLNPVHKRSQPRGLKHFYHRPPRSDKDSRPDNYRSFGRAMGGGRLPNGVHYF
jgi:hypothetical protein